MNINTKEIGDRIIQAAIASRFKYTDIWACYVEFKRQLHNMCIFDRDIELIDILQS